MINGPFSGITNGDIIQNALQSNEEKGFWNKFGYSLE
jgi:hypothetical protein